MLKYAVFVLLLVPLAARGQWGGGGCGPVGPSYSPLLSTVRADCYPAQKVEWKWQDDESGKKNASLLHNGQHVGGFNSGGEFCPRDPVTGRWGPGGRLEGFDKDGPVINYGLDLSKIHTPVNGFEAGTADVPTHNDKYPVTVRSADPKDLANVKEQVKQAGWEGKTLVAEYPPGAWQLSPGLDYNAIHVQAPPGADGKAKLLHSQPDFANLAGALRTIDPTFKPDAVPDLRNSGILDDVLKFLASTSPVAGLSWGVVLGVVVVVFVLKNKKV